MQKLNREIPKQTAEKAKLSDLNCRIISKCEVSDAETCFSVNI